MTITEQKLEGEYRYINSRLITNAEEIAFYNGNYREKLTLLAAFEKLVGSNYRIKFYRGPFFFDVDSLYSNSKLRTRKLICQKIRVHLEARDWH